MHDEDVRFDSNGCSVAGSFAEAVDPVAAALVITGSGKINRDSDALLPLGLSLRTRVTSAGTGAAANAPLATSSTRVPGRSARFRCACTSAR